MSNRRRYLRPLTLFILMAFFSLSLIGRLDSRLHIGGFDWDSDIHSQAQITTGNNPESPNRDEDHTLKSNLGLTPRDTSSHDLQLDSEPESYTTDLFDNEIEVNTVLHEQAIIEVPNGKTTTVEITDSGQNTGEIEDLGQQYVKADIERVETDTIPQGSIPKPEEGREKPTILVHTVQSGETLWDIAKSYGITVDSILSSNNIANSNRIRIGQELEILTVQGVMHEVAYGESVWEVAQRYGVALAEIIHVNSIQDPSRIQPGTKMVIPGATQLLRKDVLVVNGQLQEAFDWPAKARISSPFGPRWGSMHNGIDIAVVTGTPVRAAADGRVVYSGTNGGYGIMVILDHGNGVETRYAHHSRNAVSVGQSVKRGDIVAYSGNTGVSTGPHLHFEIRYNKNPVDPLKYLKD